MSAKPEQTIEEVDVFRLKIVCRKNPALDKKGVERLFLDQGTMPAVMREVLRRERERKVLFEKLIDACTARFEKQGFRICSVLAKAVVAHCAEAYAQGYDDRTNGKRGKGQKLRNPPEGLTARIEALRPHLNRLPAPIGEITVQRICIAYQQGWEDAVAPKTRRGRLSKTIDEKIIDLLTTPEAVDKGDSREKRLYRARQLL
jgi:hypothetical protein